MPTQLIQMTENNPSQMMGYVFALEDGRFVVIDGGTRGDAERLWAVLTENTDHPHVAAWIFTHVHYDHVSTFLELIEKHTAELTVDRVLCDFPPQDFLDAYEPDFAFSGREFTQMLPLFADRMTTPKAGEVYTFGELTVEILRNFDSHITRNAINNSSMIFAVTVCGQRYLFLGDLGVDGGKQLLSLCTPEQLRADVCQMAHHGQNGVSEEVYRAISPTICLWDTPDWLWDCDNGGGKGSGPWKTLEVRGWMEKLGTRNIVNKDGVQRFTLPL